MTLPIRPDPLASLRALFGEGVPAAPSAASPAISSHPLAALVAALAHRQGALPDATSTMGTQQARVAPQQAAADSAAADDDYNRVMSAGHAGASHLAGKDDEGALWDATASQFGQQQHSAAERGRFLRTTTNPRAEAKRLQTDQQAIGWAVPEIGRAKNDSALTLTALANLLGR